MVLLAHMPLVDSVEKHPMTWAEAEAAFPTCSAEWDAQRGREGVGDGERFSLQRTKFNDGKEGLVAIWYTGQGRHEKIHVAYFKPEYKRTNAVAHVWTFT